MAAFIPLMRLNNTFSTCKDKSFKFLERATRIDHYRKWNVAPRITRNYITKTRRSLYCCYHGKASNGRWILHDQQKSLLHVHPAVAEALRKKDPVVALESTIITHGMPYPENVKTALEVEAVIKQQNVMPATVGVVNGELIVGLTEDEIEFLGKPDDANGRLKLSRRDLAYGMSQGLSGGTTVSGTMIAASKAGIPIFVTGGIGGVHRGASTTFDVSADLTELGKTPVAVICAGVKSILDIGLTLEYLETQGVPVVAFSKDKEFPAFFTAKSGFKAPYNFENAADVARMIDKSLASEMNSGLVIGVPIHEEDSSLGQEIEQAIGEALKEAQQSGVSGRDVTPFVLEKVSQLTGGKSLQANISLIKKNAFVGARIAVELSKIQKSRRQEIAGSCRETPSSEMSFLDHDNKETTAVSIASISIPNRPVIIGGSIFDLIAVTESYDVLAEMTNKGKLYQTYGGVARNIAECLARLDHNPLLISAIGQDSPGAMILDHLNELKMDTRGVMVASEHSTASYSAIMNNGGELLLAVGDMGIHDQITPDYIQDFEEEIKSAPIVLIDGNLTTQAIEYVLGLCKTHKVPVWYEPADITKARKPFTTDDYNSIAYISPNKRELQSIHATITRSQEGMMNFNSEGPFDFEGPSEDQIIQMCLRIGRDILGSVNCLVITLGRFGVLVIRNEGCNERFPVKGRMPDQQQSSSVISATHYPSVGEDLLPRKEIKSVSGAGDCLAGAIIASILRGDEPHTCIKAGLHAAFLSLQTHEAVSDQISVERFSVQNIEDWMTWSYRDIAV